MGHTHVTRGCNYPFLTRKERDIETGLDFFEARYYASTQGRFTSPDEFTGGPLELYHFAEDASANPTFYSDLRKPQSLNRYQYAYNNPLRWIDPDGHEKNDPQKKKKPDDVDVVVIKTIDPKIISFDVKLIDRVPRVEALTKHDSRYIFNRSNRIIPQDRLVKESDIQGAVRCLVDDLKASGMFADVRAKLVRTSEVDVRKLEIETVYHRQMANFTISEIALVKLPQVDEAKFQMALKKRGITPGLPLLSYYYFGLEERINEALREALPNSLTKEDMGSAWITIRPAGKGKLKLIVSPEYSTCSSFAS